MKAPRRSADAPHDEHGADSVERFAEKHSISRALAWRLIAQGKLVARKIAGRTVITTEDAARWRRALPKKKKSVNGASRTRNAGPNRAESKPKTRERASRQT